VLAFRGTSDPWAILVSEFMAQQTQAARAAEAWTRFLVEYPTPAALAAATPADVLRSWRGLGYNRRALALRETARLLVADHGGRVPGDLDALLRLPGIGPYTARAVAALAFGRPTGAVDTNVRRVLGRAIGGLDGMAGPELQAAADRHVPADRPGLWTHALMDIGATFCKPRAPRCDDCPLQPWCRYAAEASASKSASRAATPGRRVPRVDRVTPRHKAEPTFRSTSRWLRGRILDRLRDAPSGTWVAFDSAIGEHEQPAISTALGQLSRERLLELRDRSDSELSALEARLPEA